MSALCHGSTFLSIFESPAVETVVVTVVSLQLRCKLGLKKTNRWKVGEKQIRPSLIYSLGPNWDHMKLFCSTSECDYQVQANTVCTNGENLAEFEELLPVPTQSDSDFLFLSPLSSQCWSPGWTTPASLSLPTLCPGSRSSNSESGSCCVTFALWDACQSAADTCTPQLTHWPLNLSITAGQAGQNRLHRLVENKSQRKPVVCFHTVEGQHPLWRGGTLQLKGADQWLNHKGMRFPRWPAEIHTLSLIND